MENPKINSNRYWFAFYTKPRHEFKAAQQLAGAGCEYYLPTVTVMKQWSDRKKKVTEPLLKSYIFARINERERLDALQLNTIVATVSFKGIPARVPDWQIENLRTMIEKGKNVAITHEIKIGQHVKVIDGPMSGIEGIVYQTANNESMIAITIDILRRSVVAQINIADVKVLKDVEITEQVEDV